MNLLINRRSNDMAATEHDQVFLEYVVKALVDQPDKVEIKRTVDERGVLLELTVDPEDMGKIIGKGGATAKSIRTLLRVLGAKDDARYNLKIVDQEGSERPTKEGSEDKEDIVSEESALAEEAPAEEPTAEEDSAKESKAEDIKAKAREGIEDLDTDI
jgi:predicted RNA-binding protein YlqC (UPF0109 family)